jgi:glutathione synthase/RimK-type ligase-like ATP-grasp enzyme
MEPTVGILTFADDLHGWTIKDRIERRHGTRCSLIPGNELALAGGLTWSTDADVAGLLPTADGESVDVASLNTMWYRRAPVAQTLPEGVDAGFAPHVDLASERALHGLLLNEFRGRWISHPVATRQAENKLVQLRAAQRAGLAIPATLVSQEPRRIRAFCSAHPAVIVKPVATPRGGELAPTALVSQELLENDEVLALSPAIYQECVPGGRHLRISVVGSRCDAALIEAEHLDWRVDVDVPFSQVRLDRELEETLLATLRELGLAMGIFDVKLDDRDEPYFLEVNPQGQFLFVEGMCGIPLADTLADFLVSQARCDARLRRDGARPSVI